MCCAFLIIKGRDGPLLDRLISTCGLVSKPNPYNF